MECDHHGIAVPVIIRDLFSLLCLEKANFFLRAFSTIAEKLPVLLHRLAHTFYFLDNLDLASDNFSAHDRPSSLYSIFFIDLHSFRAFLLGFTGFNMGFGFGFHFRILLMFTNESFFVSFY